MSEYPRITEIGTELAVPFVKAYALRWKLPIDTTGAENVEWWGAWYFQSLRAVVGIMSVLPAQLVELFPDDDALFVYGFYGDGSLHELRAIDALWRRLNKIPRALVGTIHLPNTKMYRTARKAGWQLRAVLPQHVARVMHKPAEQSWAV